MSHIVKYSGTITASTGAAVATTDTPSFNGRLVEITVGPRNEAVSSSNMMIFGRNSSDDCISKPADQFASTATIYRFAPKKSVNIANSSGATVALTSGSVPIAFEDIPLKEERVTISVNPASSAGTPTWSFSVTVDGVMNSTI